MVRESALFVMSVEVSGQLSNQDIREEVETLWTLTKHLD